MWKRSASTILALQSFTKDRKVSAYPFVFYIYSQDHLLMRLAGWKCCKPRYLTFDEFMQIPPCTTGKHSAIDDTPKPPPVAVIKDDPPSSSFASNASVTKSTASISSSHAPASEPRVVNAPSSTRPESDTDDPTQEIPPNITCKRRACGVTSTFEASREGEECVHHPGQALFHEGSKGWSCCKRRVLEFDEFMKIQGCRKKPRHLFIGSARDAAQEETLTTVRLVCCVSDKSTADAHARHDFYQTPTTVIASLFLKNIDKVNATIEFSSPWVVNLDLPTADNKRYKTQLPLAGQIDTAKSQFKIMGTKAELTLVKLDGLTWPTLKINEQRTAEIVQVGRAGRA